MTPLVCFNPEIVEEFSQDMDKISQQAETTTTTPSINDLPNISPPNEDDFLGEHLFLELGQDIPETTQPDTTDAHIYRSVKNHGKMATIL